MTDIREAADAFRVAKKNCAYVAVRVNKSEVCEFFWFFSPYALGESD